MTWAAQKRLTPSGRRLQDDAPVPLADSLPHGEDGLFLAGAQGSHLLRVVYFAYKEASLH